MNDNEREYERLKQLRLEKLGTNTPRCAMCPETDWRVMEQHHVAGAGRDPTTVILCANHHRIVTYDQKGHPSSDTAADPLLARTGHFILGLADMLRVIVEKLVEFGHALIKRAEDQIATATEGRP